MVCPSPALSHQRPHVSRNYPCPAVLIVQVTKVAEPSAYGVVVTKPGSTVIDRFVEKPVEFVGNRINAGIYMFNPSVLNRIEVSLPVRDFGERGDWSKVGATMSGRKRGAWRGLTRLSADRSPNLRSAMRSSLCSWD